MFTHQSEGVCRFVILLVQTSAWKNVGIFLRCEHDRPSLCHDIRRRTGGSLSGSSGPGSAHTNPSRHPQMIHMSSAQQLESLFVGYWIFSASVPIMGLFGIILTTHDISHFVFSGCCFSLSHVFFFTQVGLSRFIEMK